MTAGDFADELRVKPELFSRGNLSISEIYSNGVTVTVEFDNSYSLDIETAIMILEGYGCLDVEFEEYVYRFAYDSMVTITFIPIIILLILLILGGYF